MRKYPIYLTILAEAYSMSYRTIVRWYNVNRTTAYGRVPVSFSWIIWEVEHNHRPVEESIINAPFEVNEFSDRCNDDRFIGGLISWSIKRIESILSV